MIQTATSVALTLLFSVAPAFAEPATPRDLAEREDRPATAPQQSPDAVVQAATDDAVARLYAQVGDEAVDAGLTVGQLLDAVRGQTLLTDVLRKSEQVGGPRVLSRQIVQVRLQVDGAVIRDTIVRAVEANEERSPLKADRIKALTKLMVYRTFSATGTADAAMVNVSPSTQPSVVDAARLNAAEAMLNRIVESQGKTNPSLTQLLQDPQKRERVLETLSHLKLTQIEQGGSEVRVTGVLTLDNVRPQLDEINGFSPALAEAIRAQAAMPVTGRAEASAPQRVELPPAPTWVADPITVSASAPAEQGGPLRAARAAERSARESLRAKLQTLAFDDGSTLADAGQKDASIREALDEAVAAARVSGVNYQSDGGAEVHLSIDGQQVWQSILMR
ncbi:MAG: hypothetical protein QM770_12950 [Tepidisphaeraceae bacterium]